MCGTFFIDFWNFFNNRFNSVFNKSYNELYQSHNSKSQYSRCKKVNFHAIKLHSITFSRFLLKFYLLKFIFLNEKPRTFFKKIIKKPQFRRRECMTWKITFRYSFLMKRCEKGIKVCRNRRISLEATSQFNYNLKITFFFAKSIALQKKLWIKVNDGFFF